MEDSDGVEKGLPVCLGFARSSRDMTQESINGSRNWGTPPCILQGDPPAVAWKHSRGGCCTPKNPDGKPAPLS